MKFLAPALVYTGLALGAISAQAETPDITPMLTGEMKKLAVHSKAKPLADVAWQAPDGTARLSEYRGKWVLLNFWAVWCAPCREEMPTLAALQQAEEGSDFAVLTLATGPNQPAAMNKFLTEANAESLPRYRDPKSEQARAAGVFGLPVTVIVNPEGEEIARLIGTADWNSEEARSLLATLRAARG
ncbi:TlpA disulfide reductase family protein [Pseudooceanicola aestuarii]|uniref:TlpA disulfide reductase family protein n=1 Tax=Pseudooceanicola aestuarii TaxID=2697319 RepID=UPI0013D81D4D|nr:TlpA disulfide reductase family protein [Pseudooceanicola aestuarii]